MSSFSISKNELRSALLLSTSHDGAGSMTPGSKTLRIPQPCVGGLTQHLASQHPGDTYWMQALYKQLIHPPDPFLRLVGIVLTIPRLQMSKPERREVEKLGRGQAGLEPRRLASESVVFDTVLRHCLSQPFSPQDPRTWRREGPLQSPPTIHHIINDSLISWV